MEKELTVIVPTARGGEEGLTIVCKSGQLFRNDSRLEELYRDGFRVYNYHVLDQHPGEGTEVKVLLRK